MITKLNLATKPFTNRSLPWTIAAIMLFVSLVAFVFIIRASTRATAEAAVIQREIRNLRQEEESLEKQAAAVQKSFSPEQLLTLKAAHELVDRKHFSWSRLFVDLEAVLPGSVRVTRISVRDVAARGDQTVAELDLTVVAKSSATITEMISDMDRAGVFEAELRSQNWQKGRSESVTEYELNVVYRPRAGMPLSENQTSRLAQIETTPAPSAGEPK